MSVSWDLVPRVVRGVAIAAVSLAIAIRYGIFVAGAADGFGYVSEAFRVASGHFTAREPLAEAVPALGTSAAWV